MCGNKLRGDLESPGAKPAVTDWGKSYSQDLGGIQEMDCFTVRVSGSAVCWESGACGADVLGIGYEQEVAKQEEMPLLPPVAASELHGAVEQQGITGVLLG